MEVQLTPLIWRAAIWFLVLVKIHASSINSWDWELLNATPFVNRMMFGLIRPKRLKTLGIDIAGRVESAGSKVTRWQPGDDVFADLSACGWGGFAEYATKRDIRVQGVTVSREQLAYAREQAVFHSGSVPFLSI